MANRFPLVVDSINLNIKELPSGDNLDLTGSAVVNGAWQGNSISTTYTDAKIVSVSNTAPISVVTSSGAVTVALLSSGVSAASYGGTGNTISITVDSFGRITSASNVSTTTGVVAGTYGGTAVEGVFTVDAFGRITAASNVTAQVANTNITGLITSSQIASVANTQLTGLVTSAQIASVANTQITGNITASQIAPTGVTATTYGGASSIPAITIDAQGRITAASNVAVTAGVTTGKSIAMAIVFGG